ncbi:MAG TPA: diguanylate cyclase [Polyangiaceae bacterium LLY-WYZ-15_(1-7)]|nr:diguanylate cyclase [Polyangiaceae bacterium LLY-WYZ-15_(1-7)]HJL12244.1 diguanylate cyclase [Polyangiaceae bacterium LLY-WYZ-15_(1-7)]
MTDPSRAAARAEAALVDLARAPDRRAPATAHLLLAAARRGADVELDAQLAFWEGRAPGSRGGDARYRWELRHERAPDAGWCGPASEWTTWRPGDADYFAREPARFEERLTVPIAVVGGLALLERCADDERTRALLAEALPVARRDFAQRAQMAHAWADLFALHVLVRAPRVLEHLEPFAIAIASCWAPELAADGLVQGVRFPFHGQPLPSASAMLAGGLLALGIDVPQVARLAAGLLERTSDGARWADGAEAPDFFTTFLVAELLARVDPAFDPLPAARFVAAAQGEDGLFRALGPEAPWLTDSVARFLRATERPFAERFEWPHLPDANRDHKTKLPFYAYFVRLAELLGALPGLAAADCELAFLDLCGFRAFNNRFGQERGDAVLAAVAGELDAIEGVVAVRDGGDEFLLVGAPTGEGLGERLRAFRARWPEVFAARFGADVPPVRARVLLGVAEGGRVRAARERLGREVGALKQLDEEAPLRELGRL